MAEHNPVCCIIPNFLLQHIVDSPHTSEIAKGCARRSIHHNINHLQARINACSRLGGDHNDDQDGGAPHRQGIVPPHVFQEMRDNSSASNEQSARAQKGLDSSHQFRAARVGETEDTTADTKATAAKATKGLTRIIYDAEKQNDLPGNRVRKEGQTTTLDTQEQQVWDAFGYTYLLYSNQFKRNSIDNKGLSLIGSVHYDDEVDPPGYDNAFWDGQQMVFGDGDADIFQDFTRSIDVIGHELTHGVTQYTANLPYHQQSGALNESMSDCFGSMVKQYKDGKNPQKATDADWLIGEGIFYPATGIKALRSMKAPGTAYKDTVIGSDRQPDNMSKYDNLPDTDDGDYGGVHINSGIPNKAFYLVAVGLEGYSWEVAGQIWYSTLLDPELKKYAAVKANYGKVFGKFAELTVKHAAQYKKDGKDVVAIVKKAWDTVGVKYSASTTTGGTTGSTTGGTTKTGTTSDTGNKGGLMGKVEGLAQKVLGKDEK